MIETEADAARSLAVFIKVLQERIEEKLKSAESCQNKYSDALLKLLPQCDHLVCLK